MPVVWTQQFFGLRAVLRGEYALRVVLALTANPLMHVVGEQESIGAVLTDFPVTAYRLLDAQGASTFEAPQVAAGITVTHGWIVQFL